MSVQSFAMRDQVKPTRPARNPESIFGKAVSISGDLVADDPILIDGVIDGDVRGTLVMVGREASVTGSIFAEAVAVAGCVNGLIKAASVSIAKHARLTGEIICESLEVEEGANISAHCKAWR